MSTFQYNVAPKSTGGFTTRVVLGAEINETTLDAAVSTATGVPADKCPLVFKEYLKQLLLCGAESCWKHVAYGMIRVQPTSGGSEALPTDFHNAADINAGFNITFTREVLEAWQSTLTIESMGEVGIITPTIETIINETNSAIDTYVPGGPIRIRGNHLRLDQTDTTQGVFFKAGAAAEVRAQFYSAMEPGQIVVTVPGTLTGPLSVRIATFINGSVRSYTYTNVITL